MGFKSSMPYSFNPQLEKQVELSRFDRDFGVKNLNAKIAGRSEDIVSFEDYQKYGGKAPSTAVDRYGMPVYKGKDLNKQYFQQPDHIRYDEANVTDLDRQGMGYKKYQENLAYQQQQADLKTYGDAGRPTIINDTMQNTQENQNMLLGDSSPFNDTTQNAATGIYGNLQERTAAVSPLAKKIDPKAIFNAVDAYNTAMNLGGAIASQSQSPGVNSYNTKSNSMSSVPLPGLPTSSTKPSTNTGSYSNPLNNPGGTQNTINLNTGGNTQNSKYSFLDNQDAFKVSDPNRSSFLGTYKRNTKSFDDRIAKATEQGKMRKVARLKQRQKNFNENQSQKGGINIGFRMPFGKNKNKKII